MLCGPTSVLRDVQWVKLSIIIQWKLLSNVL